MDSRRTTEATAQKKAYEQPSLTKYGKLKDLTTGGSTGTTENNGKEKTRRV